LYFSTHSPCSYFSQASSHLTCFPSHSSPHAACTVFTVCFVVFMHALCVHNVHTSRLLLVFLYTVCFVVYLHTLCERNVHTSRLLLVFLYTVCFVVFMHALCVRNVHTSWLLLQCPHKQAFDFIFIPLHTKMPTAEKTSYKVHFYRLQLKR